MILRYFCILFIFFISASYSAEIVYRVPIQSTIDLGLPPFIERAVQEAKEEGASAIIFDTTANLPSLTSDNVMKLAPR